MNPIFAVPILLGIGLLLGSFGLFRRKRLDPKYFAIAVIVSALLVVSPGVYLLLGTIKSLFGIVYTFVLAFGLAILLLIALTIYLVLVVGKLREETDGLWQEIALLQAEHSDSETRSADRADD